MLIVLTDLQEIVAVYIVQALWNGVCRNVRINNGMHVSAVHIHIQKSLDATH